MKYYPIAVESRTDTVKMVQRIKLNLNDYTLNFGSYFLDEEDGFSTEIVEKRSMPYANTFQNAITYELSLHRKEYNRRVYNFLDFLGDLGGLMAIIGKVFVPLVAILTYRGDMHMLLLDNEH